MARRTVNLVSSLEQARRAAKVTRADAASATGRCVETIARYERGECAVPTGVLVQLASLYEVAPGSLAQDPAAVVPATIAADLASLGQRLPPRERSELRRIVGELAALVGDLHRLVPSRG